MRGRSIVNMVNKLKCWKKLNSRPSQLVYAKNNFKKSIVVNKENYEIEDFFSQGKGKWVKRWVVFGKPFQKKEQAKKEIIKYMKKHDKC